MEPPDVARVCAGTPRAGAARDAKAPKTRRQVSKPLTEKRRRARINHSLAQLRALLLRPGAPAPCGHSRLEKAAILEMTVRRLRAETAQPGMGINPSLSQEVLP
nr:PREDICTED: transcription factor HES-4-like [Lepisosteus oculatus]